MTSAPRWPLPVPRHPAQPGRQAAFPPAWSCRVWFLALAVLILAGCPDRVQALTVEEVRQAFRDRPELVLDPLSANAATVFDLSEAGVEEKQRRVKVQNWKDQMATPRQPALPAGIVTRGKATAPVVMTAYLDLLNPVYAQDAPVLKKLLETRPDVRFLAKHLPLGFEGLSQPASALFEALARQNPDLAWRFHDAVLARQKEFLAVTNPAPATVREKALVDLALSLGAEPGALDRDRRSQAVLDRLAADRAEAKRFGLTASPVYLIGGAILNGQPALEDFLQVLTLLSKPGAKP
jgi:protein-disulfide isomerase